MLLSVFFIVLSLDLKYFSPFRLISALHFFYAKLFAVFYAHNDPHFPSLSNTVDSSFSTPSVSPNPLPVTPLTINFCPSVCPSDFIISNPNRARSLISAFAGNMVHFHSKKGDGYAFIGDCIIELDALNPQVAARLAGMVYCMCYHLLKCFISKSRNFIQEYLLDPNPSPSLPGPRILSNSSP
jgi:Domain of unknown function (DUF3458_C) ARM repeats